MAFTPNIPIVLLLLVVVLVLLPTPTLAFGAGDIPDFAYLNDKAFRHGDIENILENLAKTVGGGGGGGAGALAAAFGGGGVLGFAKTVLQQASGGSKFSKSDVKKVYFGNWLRDYSQAMDIGGLSKLSADTLVLIVRVLGFMTFGFATEEFEVTPDRLGVYLPVEHIDNPKGYAEKEGDARRYHPKLRPPVDSRELEIDERTGMKAYMATEGRGWDTSTAFIRRTFRACIEHGRRANGHEGADLWETYRLLGTGLHTMEDLLAHSNWCEVALRKMGHEDVFCHVGDRVIVNTPNGPAPPLVTGTFGGADFLHSLIGEAGDKLSQASVTDLSQKLNSASNDDAASSNTELLKSLLSKFAIGGSDDKVHETEQMQQQAKAYHFNPDNIAPQEVQQQLIQLLKWRDSIMRQILEKIEMIPMLGELIEQFTNALNAYVYTVLAPYLGPILSQATGVLDEGSKAVINNNDQYEVFDNPHASDPSHSLLSKDHFGLILNEPAGKIAQIVVEHSVNLIVQAWADDSNPDRVIDKILEAFHHPYYATGRSQIQNAMFECLERWIADLGEEDSSRVIEALSKESVRNHQNKRLGSEEQDWSEPGYGGHSHCGPQAYGSNSASAYRPVQTQEHGGGYEAGSQSYQQESYSSGGRYDSNRRNQDESFEGTYGSSYNTESSRRHHDDNEYDNSGNGGYDRSSEQTGYGRPRNDDEYGGYSSRRNDEYGGRNDEYGGRTESHSERQEYIQQSSYQTSSYSREETSSYSYDHENSGPRRNEDRYGSDSDRFNRRNEDDYSGRDDSYTRSSAEEGYGVGRSYNTGDNYNERLGNNYGQEESYGHRERSGYADRDNEYGGGRGGNFYGRNEETSYSQEESYGEEREDVGEEQEYGSHSGEYGNSYGGNEETFGAERLRINEEGERYEEGYERY